MALKTEYQSTNKIVLTNAIDSYATKYFTTSANFYNTFFNGRPSSCLFEMNAIYHFILWYILCNLCMLECTEWSSLLYYIMISDQKDPKLKVSII